MKKNRYISQVIILLAIFFLFLSANPLSSQFKFDPSYKWYSIKTRHFRIHYHKELDHIAKKFAPMAERIHKKLTQIMKWKPFFRTDVVLVDNMDMPNGFASPFPFNRIQLFISRPPVDGALHNFYNWLELVFIHEYTHILSMDMVSGIPGGLRKIIGRYFFPNAMVPIWILEGYAVYSESKIRMSNVAKNPGRLNSNFINMILRMDFLSGREKKIYHASTFPRIWPSGQVPYLYGGYFVDFIEEMYRDIIPAESSFAYLFHVTGNNIIPFLNNKNSRDVYYGKTFDYLWDKWTISKKKKFLNEKKIISEDKLSSYQIITNHGFNTGLSRFSRDGTKIYYIRQDNSSRTALYAYSLNQASKSKLAWVNYPTSITEGDEGIIFLADVELYNSYSFFSEIFSFDPKKTFFRYQKISARQRSIYLDYSPKIGQFVYIKQEADIYSLILKSKDFSQEKTVIKATSKQLANCRFSPDGKKISFVLKDENGRSNLAILEMENSSIFLITDNNHVNISPAWHPDSTKIIFASDKSGVYNLYEIDLNKKIERRLTNVLGGAFQPDIHPEGKQISFSIYKETGFDIALMDYPDYDASLEKNPKWLAAVKFIPISIESDALRNEKDNTFKLGTIKSQEYSTWRNLLPVFWLPFFYSEEVYPNAYDMVYGFSTMAIDTLFQHSYTFSLAIFQRQKRLAIDLHYMLDIFYPTIFLGYENNRIFFAKDDLFAGIPENSQLTRETQAVGYIRFDIPFLSIRRRHLLQFFYSYGETFYDEFTKTNTLVREKNILLLENTFYALYYFSSTDYYSYSISPENGTTFLLFTEVKSESGKLTGSYYKVEARLGQYFPFIWHNQVLAFLFFGGITKNFPKDVYPYWLGKIETGGSDGNKFGIRGYPVGLLHGKAITKATFEYRLPILQVDFGYSTVPIHFRDLWIVVFTEAGKLWEEKYIDNNVSLKTPYRSSAGIEIHARISLLYQMGLEGYIGFARGFENGGEDQIYFAVGTSYTNLISKKNAFIKNRKW